MATQRVATASTWGGGATVATYAKVPLSRHRGKVKVKYLYGATRQLAIEAPQLLSCRSGIIV